MRTRIENIVTGPDPDGIDVPFFFWGDEPSFDVELDELVVDDTAGLTAVLMLPARVQGRIARGANIQAEHLYTIFLEFVKTGAMEEDRNVSSYTDINEMTQLAAKFVSRLQKDLMAIGDERNRLITWSIGAMNTKDAKDFSSHFDNYDINVNGVLLALQAVLVEPFEDCLK